jgi:hypothetical protein
MRHTLARVSRLQQYLDESQPEFEVHSGQPTVTHLENLQHSPSPRQSLSVEQERPAFQHILLLVQYSDRPPQSELE